MLKHWRSAAVSALMACASLAAPSDALAQNLAPSTISARALPSDGAINGGAVPPTITMSATPSGTGHEEFALTIRFSQSVLGFREDEIGLSVGDLWDFSGSGTAYTATIEPPADYEGTITVSIAKGAAISLFDEDNAEAAYSFYVDNVAPRLYDAFVEGDELVLIYDNALTVAVAPDPRDYSVRVEGRIRDVTRVQVRGDEVTLILNPAVRFRDEVVVSYTPGTRPLSDAVGNVVDALVREPVTNRTSENAGVPSAPRSLSAYAAGSSVIELDWTAPADPGSAVVDGYRIEVWSDGGSTWDVLERDTRNAVTSYRHTGLLSHTTRHYRVSAINNFGVSEPSNTASATTTGRVPAAPTGLTATVFGSSRIDLRWRASSGGSGGAVTGYRIEFSDNRLSGWSTLVSDTRSTSTAYSDTGLPPGTTRYYRVSGINRAGVGSASNVDDATTQLTRPGQPTNLQATPSSTSRINLSWAAPASDGGERITGYVVESSTDGGTSWSVVVSNTGSATRYSHTMAFRVSGLARPATIGWPRSIPGAGVSFPAQYARPLPPPCRQHRPVCGPPGRRPRASPSRGMPPRTMGVPPSRVTESKSRTMAFRAGSCCCRHDHGNHEVHGPQPATGDHSVLSGRGEQPGGCGTALVARPGRHGCRRAECAPESDGRCRWSFADRP